MRLAGLRSLLFGALALLAAGGLAGCENPFDPIEKSSKIEGLSYVDFSSTWDRWDSDPEYDGLSITVDYYNEFGDGLSFHDKAHEVIIEFWTQEDTGTEDSPFYTKGTLLYSRSVTHDNSDDTIRIPSEAYSDQITGAIDETSGEATGFMVVRVFPPEDYPRDELTISQTDVTFFKPETAEGTANE